MACEDFSFTLMTSGKSHAVFFMRVNIFFFPGEGNPERCGNMMGVLPS